MSKYEIPGGAENQFQPGSNKRVLRNKLGIDSSEVMQRAETLALASAQKTTLEWFEDDTPITTSLICDLHGLWLGSIYDFAGKYRDVNLSKGGVTFCVALNIPTQMANLEAAFLAPFTPCSGLELDEVCDRVAKVHAELLLIHPFREGNGRVARWVSNLMFYQAGLPAPIYGISPDPTDDQRVRYFKALREGYFDHDTRNLAEMFREWIISAESNAQG